MSLSPRLILALVAAFSAAAPAARAMNVRISGLKGGGSFKAPAISRVRLGIPLLGIAGASLNASRFNLTPSLPGSAALPVPINRPPALAPTFSFSPSLTPVPLHEALGQRLNAITEASQNDASGVVAKVGFEKLYGGKRNRRGGHGNRNRRERKKERSAPRQQEQATFVINDEGVPIFGRAAAYYKEVVRMGDLTSERTDLSSSLDVMDDSYGDVQAKLSALEALAISRDISQENTHIEKSLTFIDGVLKNGKTATAVQTHRVYFHKADNPRSEIEEGIRRVDGYIDKTLKQFRSGGQAERAAGRFDEVVLVFDTRGYDEIKEHLKAREAAIDDKWGDRYTFVYLDELTEVPQETEAVRESLTRLVKKYGDQVEGLAKIVEGVIYSRYVGLLLELKTVEYYLNEGYSILQSGEELFDADGQYVTELDVVAQKGGQTTLIEAKSARVELPFEEVLEEKVERKLAVYQAHRAELEVMLGDRIDKVVFSIDVGPLETDIPDDPAVVRRIELIEFLRGEAPRLSEEYGFSVDFLFLFSSPEEKNPRPY